MNVTAPEDDKAWKTACAANDRNVLMANSVNNCISHLWKKCMIMCMIFFCNLYCLSTLHLFHDFSNGYCV